MPKLPRVESLHREIDWGKGVERFAGDVLVVDGNHMAHRCRYTFDLSNNGLDTSVTYGFLNTLTSLMRKFDTAAVVVCWDEGVPAFRKERVPSYKAHRTKDEDTDWQDFYRQTDELDMMLPYFGIASVRRPACEADDLMYQATRMLHSDWRKVVITSDKDLLQCVRYDTVWYSPNNEVEVSNDNFLEVTGVTKEDFLVYRCMVGDSSDGIPGIHGIGEKTALKLIEEYGASASNLINVANGRNPEAKPMSDKMAQKFRTYGLKGFQDTMAAIRLDYDLTGARLSLYFQFHQPCEFDRREVKAYLMENAFASLMKPEMYRMFESLKSPKLLLAPELCNDLPMPVIAPRRVAPREAPEQI